jgi:hypothetical protein
LNVIDMITAMGQVQARGALQPSVGSVRSAADFAAVLTALQLGDQRSGGSMAATTVAPVAVPVSLPAPAEADAAPAPADAATGDGCLCAGH